MLKKILKLGAPKITTLLLCSIFLIFGLEFLVSFNFFPKHLTETYLFEVGRQHYTAQLSSLLRRPFKINFHIILAIYMLIVGVLQFSDRVRLKFPKFHRYCGYSYYIVGFPAVVIGIAMAHLTLGGLETQLTFYFIAGFWILSGFLALKAIFRKRILEHKLWSYRNYFMVASTGLIRPFTQVIDLVFPGRSAEQIFSSSTVSCLVFALALWVFVPINNPKKRN